MRLEWVSLYSTRRGQGHGVGESEGYGGTKVEDGCIIGMEFHIYTESIQLYNQICSVRSIGDILLTWSRPRSTIRNRVMSQSDSIREYRV